MTKCEMWRSLLFKTEEALIGHRLNISKQKDEKAIVLVKRGFHAVHVHFVALGPRADVFLRGNISKKPWWFMVSNFIARKREFLCLWLKAIYDYFFVSQWVFHRKLHLSIKMHYDQKYLSTLLHITEGQVGWIIELNGRQLLNRKLCSKSKLQHARSLLSIACFVLHHRKYCKFIVP